MDERRGRATEDSPWSIALAAEHVFAYPDPAGQGRGVETESIPVVVRRRDTGTLVQRLVFPTGDELAATPPPEARWRAADAGRS